MSESFVNQISLNLMVGIVSGVLTLIGVWFFKVVWESKLIPWFEEKQYKGSEIAGIWDTQIKYADGDENTIIYRLKRKSVTVTGEAECTKGVSTGMKWKLDGYFENLILTLSYKSMDRTKIDKGSVTLMLKNNGASLKGHLNYYSDLDNCIKSVPMELSRSE